MSAFPGSPRILKGALAALDPLAPRASVVLFQYNPERLTRTLEPRHAGSRDGDPSEATHLSGPPAETIQMEVVLDATDQLAAGDPIARAMGIHPQLSVLETLVTPALARVLTNTGLLALGTLEVLPPAAPLAVLVWGPRRVLPVRVHSLAITEEAYDTQLNPLRARVDLTLRALTYDDLPHGSAGYGLALASLHLKEVMAHLGGLETAATLLASGGVPFGG